MEASLSPHELELFRKYFGEELERIDVEEFRKKRKELQVKYHPDKFEQHEDVTIKEMALEKYQEIEQLSDKAKAYLENKIQGKPSIQQEIFLDSTAQFSADGLFIEVITQDKDLKYHMFGTRYRWLEMGDKFKIPNTQAYIRIEANYAGVAVGFKESIKMFLSFSVQDPIDEIILWLYRHIAGRANSLLVDKTPVAIDPLQMSYHIRKRTFKALPE